MIKAMGSYSGRPLLVLGLSSLNMARLMDDQPITVDCTAIGGPDLAVLLVGGRTEGSIVDHLRSVGLVS